MKPLNIIADYGFTRILAGISHWTCLGRRPPGALVRGWPLELSKEAYLLWDLLAGSLFVRGPLRLSRQGCLLQISLLVACTSAGPLACLKRVVCFELEEKHAVWIHVMEAWIILNVRHCEQKNCPYKLYGTLINARELSTAKPHCWHKPLFW